MPKIYTIIAYKIVIASNPKKASDQAGFENCEEIVLEDTRPEQIRKMLSLAYAPALRLVNGKKPTAQQS